MRLEIDLGRYEWRHPGEEGVSWGSHDAAVQGCRMRDLDPILIQQVDTRITIAEVAKAIRKSEGHVWDEYVDVAFGKISGEKIGQNKWPLNSYRWVAVYVVEGGSEGFYLHVDAIHAEGSREMLILGKTLNASWEDCYASAGRIAKALGA